MGHVLWILFGPGAWGTGGNLVAWVLCGALAFGWLHLAMKERHVQALAQAAAQHKERLAQAAAQHEEAMTLGRRQHQQALDQAEAHHVALKAHVTAAVAADAQASGGPGRNPGTAGLAADQRVVPPPAALAAGGSGM